MIQDLSPFLWIGIILASLSLDGNVPSERDSLMIWERGVVMCSMHLVISEPGILSRPLECLVLSFLAMISISSSHVGKRKRDLLGLGGTCGGAG